MTKKNLAIDMGRDIRADLKSVGTRRNKDGDLFARCTFDAEIEGADLDSVTPPKVLSGEIDTFRKVNAGHEKWRKVSMYAEFNPEWARIRVHDVVDGARGDLVCDDQKAALRSIKGSSGKAGVVQRVVVDVFGAGMDLAGLLDAIGNDVIVRLRSNQQQLALGDNHDEPDEEDALPPEAGGTQLEIGGNPADRPKPVKRRRGGVQSESHGDGADTDTDTDADKGDVH